MVNSTKLFIFNGVASNSFTPSIINATLNNEMYEFAPLGAKSLIEQKIQGRDLPYFYTTDLEPLSFSMTIAFEDYTTQDQVGEIIKWLYLPNSPKLLRFPEYNMNYFGVFIGQPNFYYVGNNRNGFKFIGYIEVTFRANAPYGWTNLLRTANNSGDMETLPSFSVENTFDGGNVVKIQNNNNDSYFEYSLIKDEILTFNGYNKILSSNKKSNPYASWINKGYLIFEPGLNNLTVTNTAGAGTSTILYSYRAPKILAKTGEAIASFGGLDGATPETYPDQGVVPVTGVVTAPTPNPMKAGFNFTGWSPSFDENGQATINEDTLFQAQFTIKPNVTATFGGLTGATPSSYSSQSVQPDIGIVTSPGSPTKTNFFFLGWEPSLPRTISENTEFQALFVSSTLQSPTIGSISCAAQSNNEVYVFFTVNANNPLVDGLIIEASLNSNFSNSISNAVNGGKSTSFSLLDNANGDVPGSTIVYVRAKKTGFTNSSTSQKTVNLTFCLAELI